MLQVASTLDWRAILGQDVTLATDADCQKFVQDNANALTRVREAFSLPCRVPVDLTYGQIYLNSTQDRRSLARAFDAEARAALASGRREAALRAYLDMIRLSVCFSHGGIMIDDLIADAIASIGLERLAVQMPLLDIDELSFVRQELEPSIEAREPFGKVLERESTWISLTHGWPGRLLNWATGEIVPDSSSRASRLARARVDALLRLTITEAAVRLYQLRNGVPPATLAELVPEYLSAVPQDPFAAGPLVYRPDGADYLLYSVGGNGADDSGQRGTITEATVDGRGDLFFDAAP